MSAYRTALVVFTHSQIASLRKIRLSALTMAVLALAICMMSLPTKSYATDAVADKLDQIYEIQKLKARYFRLMDQKKWSEWGDVFTNDATVKTTAFGIPVVWTGKSQIVSQNSTYLKDVLSVHHGHMPEIEITSATTATGIWAMEDYLEFAGALELQGGGHYYETYVKENGKWKIKSLELRRLRESIGTTVTN